MRIILERVPGNTASEDLDKFDIDQLNITFEGEFSGGYEDLWNEAEKIIRWAYRVAEGMATRPRLNIETRGLTVPVDTESSKSV